MSTNNGKTSKINVSNNYREGEPFNYNYKQDEIWALEKVTNERDPVNQTLYEKAESLERIATFELKALEPKEQLEYLKKEVKVRIGISKREIFLIGKVLIMAKEVCRQEKIGFKKWIIDNFDFSYETGNNFMNVYKYCFSQMYIAVQLPQSILYKISAPGFPDDLRNYLFENGKLDELTNGKLKKLINKFEEGGIESIEGEIDALTSATRFDRQVRNTFDQFENALRTLNEIIYKMERIKYFGQSFGIKISGHDPDAQEAQQILYNAITKAYEDMDKAKDQADEIHDKYIESVNNIMQED